MISQCVNGDVSFLTLLWVCPLCAMAGYLLCLAVDSAR